MGFEWAALLVTAVVGLAGIAATYYTGKRQSDTQLQAQREERHQRRLEAAYVPLMDALTEGAEWFQQLDAFIVGDTPGWDSPKMPESVKAVVGRGSLTSVWSPRVAGLAQGWARASALAYTRAQSIAHHWAECGEKAPPGGRNAGPASSIDERIIQRIDYLDERFKAEIAEARVAAHKIRDQVWRELRGEDAGHLNRL
jgi:hypothetical protein